MKPLEDRIIETLDDSIWRISNLLITDPSQIDEPEIVEHAKKEMLRFNALKCQLLQLSNMPWSISS